MLKDFLKKELNEISKIIYEQNKNINNKNLLKGTRF